MTALARYTLRAEAHRLSQPSLILAALNQALLDWLTDDPSQAAVGLRRDFH